MYCINCGKELPENARFCFYCGTKVYKEEKPQVSNEEVLISNFVNTIPFIYDELSECTEYPYIYASINGKEGLLDANDASIVIPCQYDEITPYFYTESKEFAYSEIRQNNKWGFFEKGKEIIPCIYDRVNQKEYNNTRTYIGTIGNKKGLINSNTWTRTECIYDEIEVIHNLFGVSCNGKQGMLELDFSELLPCRYDSILTFKADNQKQFFCLEYHHKYGVCSFKEGMIIPCIYDNINMFDIEDNQKQLFCVELHHKYGVCSFKEGILVAEMFIPCEYDSISISNDRFLILKQNNKYGIYDSVRHEEIEPCIHSRIQSVNVIDTKTDDKFIEIKFDNRTVIKELITHKTITVNKLETLLLDFRELLDSLNIKHY